jgi:hypothetical protein
MSEDKPKEDLYVWYDRVKDHIMSVCDKVLNEKIKGDFPAQNVPRSWIVLGNGIEVDLITVGDTEVNGNDLTRVAYVLKMYITIGVDPQEWSYIHNLLDMEQKHCEELIEILYN